ncbi:hypothetical protein [Coralloluteibacterium thermophilus]|uniref:Uncharacterized protein n=1 Tax=Coralloluteibacterium thermophilum TaxID=2707049 RepID=A0ABV9NJH9_9GAMM
MSIEVGKTYQLRTGNLRTKSGKSESAKVTQLQKNGRGYTVHFTVGKDAKQLGLGEFQRRVA